MRVFLKPRQLPTFPGRHRPSIISTTELNFRVRYGYGCVLCVFTTELLNTILNLPLYLCFLPILSHNLSNSFILFFLLFLGQALDLLVSLS